MQRTVFCAVAAVLLFGAFQIAKSMPVPQDSDGPKVLTAKLPDGKVGKGYIVIIQDYRLEFGRSYG